MCNAIIQPHFDYACFAWYSNLTQKLKKKPQVMENKCICFCLQLGKMSTICYKEFKDLNWLPVINRFEQCVVSIVLQFINGNCPYYLQYYYYYYFSPLLITTFLLFLLRDLNENKAFCLFRVIPVI